MTFEKVCQRLLDSDEPSVRWKAQVLLGDDPSSPRLERLEREIVRSDRVRKLMARALGRSPPEVYQKWQGAHWVLASLADLGYPRGDKSLHAMRDQVLDRWLSRIYDREFDATTSAQSYGQAGVPRIRGRYRRCGSQQGNALYFLEKLGIADDRSDGLVERLLHWQWPDGGWNCDRNPGADTSSFYESRHPMMGLALYSKRTGSRAAREAAVRAAEVFLSRHLFLERHTGRVMNKEFVELHYPLYWHYDILGGLKAIAEVGLTDDRRCEEALDLLEGKVLQDGGWPAEKRLYRVSPALGSNTDSVDWGGTSRTKPNDWVTADALAVLKAFGRWSPKT